MPRDHPRYVPFSLNAKKDFCDDNNVALEFFYFTAFELAPGLQVFCHILMTKYQTSFIITRRSKAHPFSLLSLKARVAITCVVLEILIHLALFMNPEFACFEATRQLLIFYGNSTFSSKQTCRKMCRSRFCLK